MDWGSVYSGIGEQAMTIYKVGYIRSGKIRDRWNIRTRKTEAQVVELVTQIITEHLHGSKWVGLKIEKEEEDE